MSAPDLGHALARAIRATATRVPIETDPIGVLERCGITPDPWQTEYLRSEHRVQLLFSCRQAGKTDITALDGIMRAACNPDSFIPIVATREDQATILVKRARRWLRRIREAGFRLPVEPMPGTRDSPRHILWENHSQLRAFPASETAVRGDTAAKVIVDEAARVADDVFTAIGYQILTTAGQLAQLTSAWYKAGRFCEAWQSRDHVPTARWRVIAPLEYARRTGLDLTGLETSGLDDPPDVEIQVCTRMTWEAFQLATKGNTAAEVRREMYGIFSDERLDSVFAHAMIQAALSHEVKPLWGGGPAASHDDDAVSPLFG